MRGLALELVNSWSWLMGGKESDVRLVSGGEGSSDEQEAREREGLRAKCRMGRSHS